MFVPLLLGGEKIQRIKVPVLPAMRKARLTAKAINLAC
jgi:hypothetical protein